MAEIKVGTEPLQVASFFGRVTAKLNPITYAQICTN